MTAPIARGVLLALAAALAFGLSTPFVQLAGRGVGPFTTAALLYVGAAGLALVVGGARPLPRWAWKRLAVVAMFGAFAAPALLAAGLARASGTAASLLLNFEAVFTVLLGALVHRELVGRRVWSALALITGGGALLVLDRSSGGFRLELGLLLVAGATLGWAIDNTLSRALSELDPRQVVAGKGLLGAVLACGTALALREPLPSFGSVAGLLACGAVGYGASLHLYLLAQRQLGSARTGSVFAIGPFVGAIAAVAIGQPMGGWLTLAGAAAIAAGVLLHLTEHHEHAHEHAAETHAHPHRHDDGHHQHTHPGADPGVVHTHEHTHGRIRHEHAHAEDVHHRHHR
jgi:drug/metabolite transporter (DMT)-like permease